MANETVTNHGLTKASGHVTLQVNAPPPSRKGVTYEGAWIRAELEDGKLTHVRLFGQASYSGRTLSQSVDLPDPTAAELEPLRAALVAVLDQWGDHIREATMEGGYQARQFARNNGEEV
jgi:hypothetical protein